MPPCPYLRSVLATYSLPNQRSQSATALGASFDPELIEEVGLKILSEESKRKAASFLLGPTCNIQRVHLSPLLLVEHMLNDI